MSDIIKKMKALVLKEVAIYNQMIIDKQNENEVAEFFEIEDLNNIAEEFFNSEKNTKKSIVKKEKKVLDESERCTAVTSSGKECSKKRTTNEEFKDTENESYCSIHILKNNKTKEVNEEPQILKEIDDDEITVTPLVKEKKTRRPKKVNSEEIIEEENL